MIISFSSRLDKSKPRTQKLCNDVLTCLIKYSADKRRLIFTHNIGLIGRIIEEQRECISELNEALVGKMLSSKELDVQNADLWRMAGIQVIALASKFGIKVNLLNALISQLDHRKRSIVYSASEVIGVVLSNQPELLQDASARIQLLFTGEAKQDLFVNVIQKVCKYQGLFALEKPILQKLLSYLKQFSASFRACILQSLRSCVVECVKSKNKQVIQEI